MRLLLLLAILSNAAAWQLQHAVGRAAAPAASRGALPNVVCGRKGRPAGAPSGAMPGQYSGMQQQAPPEPPPDGTPVFYLYCRTGPGKPWYPVSAMKGDGQSKGLINAWLNSPVAKGVFKDRLDEGMARSIFDSERRLAEMATEQYRQLNEYKARLQWGFKILDKDLVAKEARGEIEKQKIIPVNKGMLKEGILDQAKSAASKAVEGITGGGGGGDGGSSAGPSFFDQAKKAADGLMGEQKR